MKSHSSCIALLFSTIFTVFVPAIEVNGAPAINHELPPDISDTGNPLADASDYGWSAFVALNWPAAAAGRGLADVNRPLGDTSGARVWTTWKSRFEIFQPSGAAPAAWNSYDGVNPCGASFSNEGTTLSSFTAFGDFNQAIGSLSKVGNPLVAQNRTYVRYEVRVNEQEFNSIVRNEWFLGSNLPTADSSQPFDTGSIEVKAAWRILTAADSAAERSRYYVVDDANVLDVASGACLAQPVALVGFHIVIKTPSRPQWLWYTFEHVDNVLNQAGLPGAPASTDLSFNDPSAPQALSPAIRPKPIDPVLNPPLASPDPMQVIRRLPVDPEIVAVNAHYWATPEIAGTVWGNYMLVATQFPTVTSPEAPSNHGAPFPIPGTGVNLANTTMETYFQRDSDSCMSCHQLSNDVGRDFVMFVTMDAFRPSQQAPAGLFVDKIRQGGERVLPPSLSNDELIQSLESYFGATE